MNRAIRIVGVTAIVAALVATVYAEDSYPIAWTSQIGTGAGDSSYGIAVDSGGNAYISGQTTGNFERYNPGTDAFLSRFDPAGNELWTKQIGTSSEYDSSFAVAVDVLGNAYISGGTHSNLGGTNYGGGDAFLGKYDTAGNEVWMSQVGTSAADSTWSVAVDSLGNAYIAGRTIGSFDGRNNTEGDAFLSRFDAAGNELWTKQIGTSSGEYGKAVAVDSEGNAYISGHTYGNLGGVNAGAYDVFLGKYDTAGNEVWMSQIGTSGADYGSAVAVDLAGNTYVSGKTYGDLGGPNAGGWDAYLSKFDAAGNTLWTKQFGTSSSDLSQAVVVDAAGNVFVSGSTNGDLGGPNVGSSDVFLMKFDAVGNELWTTQLGTIDIDSGQSVAIDADSNVYITGYTYGDLGGVNAGNLDAFLAKYEVPEPGDRSWDPGNDGLGGVAAFVQLCE